MPAIDGCFEYDIYLFVKVIAFVSPLQKIALHDKGKTFFSELTIRKIDLPQTSFDYCFTNEAR